LNKCTKNYFVTCFQAAQTVSSGAILKLYQAKLESMLLSGTAGEFCALMLDIPGNALKAFCDLGGLVKTR
jgi:hypothetical protein